MSGSGVIVTSTRRESPGRSVSWVALNEAEANAAKKLGVLGAP